MIYDLCHAQRIKNFCSTKKDALTLGGYIRYHFHVSVPLLLRKINMNTTGYLAPLNRSCHSIRTTR